VTTRHPDSTIPQFPNPVIVVIAPALEQCDEYRRLGQELHVAPTVVVSDVQNAATMVAQWRPFAIILDQQWLEFDAEGFKALSRDVGAELVVVERDIRQRQESERVLELLKGALGRWEARELPDK
jgi:hypothetical protein